MIYCVVPAALADELLPRMQAYYADDPNVEVIVDRRESERRNTQRRDDKRGAADPRRKTRDRRRRRVAGEFPPIEAA